MRQSRRDLSCLWGSYASLVARPLLYRYPKAMERSEYAKLAAFEERYWWHVGRRSIVSRQIANLNRAKRKFLTYASPGLSLQSVLIQYCACQRATNTSLQKLPAWRIQSVPWLSDTCIAEALPPVRRSFPTSSLNHDAIVSSEDTGAKVAFRSGGN